MKKPEFTKRLAEQSNMTPAAAADQLDRVVHDLLRRVRKGKSARLPGLGSFGPGPGNAGFESAKIAKGKQP